MALEDNMTTRERGAELVRADGIEPTRPAWKAGVLPLNYARVAQRELHRSRRPVKPEI